jgi:hypothetical protein
MMRFRKATASALLTATMACSIGALAAPATASATAFQERDSFDPTGQVFTCQPTDLTVTSGLVIESLEGVQDPRGVLHLTGTTRVQDVTLTDGTNTYALSGAASFASTLNPDSGELVDVTDTTHFVIRNPSGSVYAMVQIVVHFSPDGHSFTLDRGACETPPR